MRTSTRIIPQQPQNASQRPSAIFKAWDLIGFDGQLPYEPERSKHGHGSVRIVGGRTRYEAAGNDGGSMVRLSKLKVTSGGLRAIIRYVDPDTPMEFVPEALSAPLPRGDTEMTENTSPSPESPQNAPSGLTKTVYRLEVLSDEPISPHMGIADVIEECDTGAYVLADVSSDSWDLTPQEMAKALYAAGSEPGFFALDDEGNEVD